MKCICPNCQEEINLSIFLNREVNKKNTDPTELTMIAKIVCENAGIDLEEFRKRERTRDIAKPRQQFMWLADKYTNYGPQLISRFIRPDMNHSTAIHGKKVIDDLMSSSTNDRIEMDYLCDKVEESLLLLQKAS